MDLLRCCCFCCCSLFKSSPSPSSDAEPPPKPATVQSPPVTVASPPPKVEPEVQVALEEVPPSSETPKSNAPEKHSAAEGEIDLNAAHVPPTVTAPVASDLPKATLSAPTEARAGSTIEVHWTGPNETNDRIEIADIGNAARKYFAYTRNGSPAQVLLPTQPGQSDLKYISGSDHRVLATIPIALLQAEATLSAASEARAGSTLDVEWTGPNDANDIIAIFDGSTRKSFAYTRGGTPAKVILPTKAGTYELKYVMGQDNRVLTSRPISLFPSEATLSAPTPARAGSTIAVDWTGPNDANDMIAIFDGKTRKSFAYARGGSPASLSVPTSPGTYDLKYVVGQDSTFLASIPITVTATSATLSAPTEARAGATIDVNWTGPNDSGDYIGICKGGTSDYLQYVYTSSGNPVNIQLPATPGAYELKYFVGQDGSTLANAPITVNAASATLTGPNEARAGSTIDVNWTGPNDSGDYIGIRKVGSADSLQHAYTSSGNPASIRLPTTPGTYELKYFVGQDGSTLASIPISLAAATATITGPNEARAGSTLDVYWTGPNDSGDYIGICKIGSTDSLQHAYTSSGNPASIRLPTTPGTYELKYFVGQDGSTLASIPISLAAATATITGPSEARAGATIDVNWTGPNDNGDYIGICKIGATDFLQHAYTSSGNPASIRLPTTPGTYKLKYFVGQDGSTLTSVSISVTAASATLSGPVDARAGATIDVNWTGPGDSGDYIGICKAGAKDPFHYVYTSSGNPAKVLLPTKPGPYEIKYFVDDNTVLSSASILVTASSATISGPNEARAGSTIDVAWTGPDDSGDYVGICQKSAKDALQYSYTSSGNPAKILLPTKPGSYDLKYFVGQDGSVLANVSILVTAASATLSGPNEGPAGSTVEVLWTGPDDSGDYIGICKSGAKDSLEYAYTSSGNPAKVTLPPKAGSYELKYFVGQDNSTLASIPFRVT